MNKEQIEELKKEFYADCCKPFYPELKIIGEDTEIKAEYNYPAKLFSWFINKINQLEK